jgi:Na+-transporting NADH:ubiquinone oxidoreductase subunit NqrE
MELFNLFIRSIFIENMIFAYFWVCVRTWQYQKPLKHLLA